MAPLAVFGSPRPNAVIKGRFREKALGLAAAACYSGGTLLPARFVVCPARAPRGWQHPLERSSRAVASADPLRAQLDHFCRVVRGQTPPLVDGPDATRSLAAALAVLESARRGSPVDLSRN